MPPKDLTLQVLKSIRDEARKTNVHLVQLTDRVDQLTERIRETHRHIAEGEIRVATALTEVTASVNDLTGLIRRDRDLRPRVEKCEADIQELKRAVG